jgi:hypothetical protein
MADERKRFDDVSIASQSSAAASSAGRTAGADTSAGDLADEIPVPPAMTPAEIDERAQVVEALRASGTSSLGTGGDDASPPADA